MQDLLTKYVIRARIWSDEAGQDMIEYALLVGLMTVTGASVTPSISTQVQAVFERLVEIFEKA